MISTSLLLIGLSFIAPQNDRLSESREDLRCGLYCLTVALKSLGGKTTINEVEASLGDAGVNGYSMQQLAETSKLFGFKTTASTTTPDLLLWRKAHLGNRFACITLFNENHFVLVTDVTADTVTICDPPGTYVLDKIIFEQKWNKKVLLISNDPLTKEEELVTQKQSIDRIRYFLKIISVSTVAFVVLLFFNFKKRMK